MSKNRLDVLLLERGLAESRERAKTTIMSGVVFVDGQRVDKPGTQVINLFQNNLKYQLYIF